MRLVKAGLTQGPACLLMLVLSLPLLASAWVAVSAAWDPVAWRALLADSQTWRALALSLWTGLASSALALWLTRVVLCRSFPSTSWPRLVRTLSPLLAVPHAAFAIGLAFLISPSGWLLRALSPWATGLEAPPDWPSTQDPWGLGLIAVLVAKELPFLLWAAATRLQQAEVAQRHSRELLMARSLGYPAQQAWQLVLWPQLWPRLRWPLLAVLIYSLTVVDVALVIGPTSPPTLAVLAWQWLLDADPAVNAQGAAAAWLLAACVMLTASSAWALSHLPTWRSRWTRGRRDIAPPQMTGPAHPVLKTFAWLDQPRQHWPLTLLVLPYLAVMLALTVGSVAGLWPFPQLLPDTLTLQAWQMVAQSASTVGSTLSLALAAALAALCWGVAWLEWAPPRWQTRLQGLIFLPLVLPPVLWVLGVHGLALRCGLDASWLGVALAHTVSAIPYVLIALSPAYAGFDPRLRQVTASLGHGRLVFLWRVKWPLLRHALAAGFAMGFAVSVAQYLPTQFIGAGRINTVSTEAITLAAGAQRSLTAAYAWLQWVLPVLMFALAAWLGRSRFRPSNH